MMIGIGMPSSQRRIRPIVISYQPARCARYLLVPITLFQAPQVPICFFVARCSGRERMPPSGILPMHRGTPLASKQGHAGSTKPRLKSRGFGFDSRRSAPARIPVRVLLDPAMRAEKPWRWSSSLVVHLIGGSGPKVSVLRGTVVAL
jgi:hypothetical protein